MYLYIRSMVQVCNGTSPAMKQLHPYNNILFLSTDLLLDGSTSAHIHSKHPLLHLSGSVPQLLLEGLFPADPLPP